MNEFNFIDKYLKNKHQIDETVLLGIGDDAATLKINSHQFWHISTDMLLEDRHFFSFDTAEDLAYKVLAVNLSDMAAMGAKPKWVLLSIALDNLDTNWLDSFFDTFFQILADFKIKLIGGDTTKGKKTFNITIIGETDRIGLQRNHAQVGDGIWVTGKIGLAVAGLYHHWQRVTLSSDVFAVCERARLRPNIRVEFMAAGKDLIHAAQDISDGLLQDLQHILTASDVGAKINVDLIPTDKRLRAYPQYYDWVLAGGDDYEIIFTLPTTQIEFLQQIASQMGVAITQIGEVIAQKELLLFNRNNNPFVFNKTGFDHFEDQ